MSRFRIEGAHEVLKDPGGHSRHWTILEGVLEQGSLRMGDALAIPRVRGGFWLGQAVGLDSRRGFINRVVRPTNETLGVAVWGVAPPKGSVGLGESVGVSDGEARELARDLRLLEPAVVDHCPDCRRIARYYMP